VIQGLTSSFDCFPFSSSLSRYVFAVVLRVLQAYIQTVLWGLLIKYLFLFLLSFLPSVRHILYSILYCLHRVVCYNVVFLVVNKTILFFEQNQSNIIVLTLVDAEIKAVLVQWYWIGFVWKKMLCWRPKLHFTVWHRSLLSTFVLESIKGVINSECYPDAYSHWCCSTSKHTQHGSCILAQGHDKTNRRSEKSWI
jgi:hypothetical protein